MAQTFNQGIWINGSINEAQLSVRGASNQTEHLQRWVDGLSFIRAWVEPDGKFSYFQVTQVKRA